MAALVGPEVVAAVSAARELARCAKRRRALGHPMLADHVQVCSVLGEMAVALEGGLRRVATLAAADLGGYLVLELEVEEAYADAVQHATRMAAEMAAADAELRQVVTRVDHTRAEVAAPASNALVRRAGDCVEAFTGLTRVTRRRAYEPLGEQFRIGAAFGAIAGAVSTTVDRESQLLRQAGEAAKVRATGAACEQLGGAAADLRWIRVYSLEVARACALHVVGRRSGRRRRVPAEVGG